MCHTELIDSYLSSHVGVTDVKQWLLHFSSRLLQLTPVPHFKGEYRPTPACPEWSRASGDSSSMELQLKTIAQTLTLASSPAEDNIQDRSRHIQRANFRTAILSPQSALQGARALSPGLIYAHRPINLRAFSHKQFSFDRSSKGNAKNADVCGSYQNNFGT